MSTIQKTNDWNLLNQDNQKYCLNVYNQKLLWLEKSIYSEETEIFSKIRNTYKSLNLNYTDKLVWVSNKNGIYRMMNPYYTWDYIETD